MDYSIKLAKLIVVIAALIVAIGVPYSAHAAVGSAHSTIFFDASDNIIGQRIIDCRNNGGYAGDVSDSNPNRYDQVWNCGNAYLVCDLNVPPNCQYATGPGYSQLFRSATGKSIADYCAASPVYTPGIAFSGRTECGDGDGLRVPTIDFLPFTSGNPPH